MEISASIVVYKTPPTELNSVLCSFRRSESRCRVVVVDNSPTNELREIAHAHSAEYVQTGRNIGFGAAHNLAIQKSAATSRYHIVVNPDIQFGPEVIEALTRFMDANPDVGLVMPKILYTNGSEQRLCKLLPTPFDLFLRRFLGKPGGDLFRLRLDRYELRGLDLSVPREIPCLSGCFMFLRSAVLEEVGGFDERYFMYLEDVDLCRRVGRRAKTVFYPCVSVEHGYAKGSYRDWKLLGYHLASALKYFGKWGWVYDLERDTLNTRTERFEPEPKSV